MARDRDWMDKDRDSSEWQRGMKEFLDFAFSSAPNICTIRCPCTKCLNNCYKTRNEVHLDLLRNGMDPTYSCWKHHGEESDEENIAEGSSSEEVRGDDIAVRDMLSTLIRSTDLRNIASDVSHERTLDDGGNIIEGNADGRSNQEPNACAKAFFDLLNDSKKELYPGCKEVTKLSFIVRLYQIKCLYGLSNKACEAILELFSHVLPEGHCIPNSLEKVQKVIRDLGLDYQKIHACINDCVLFRKEYANLDCCPICGHNRWKVAGCDDTNEVRTSHRANKPVPCKVLRYFPLTPRLQRLFMTDATSSCMQWHKDGRTNDGTMRHPADSLAWKHFDDMHPEFSLDARNVRLGLASDGFNPYGIMNVSYSTWPVILIPYNLPPWLCLKQPYWIMSMIIPGPKSPGNNIDVYLQPLIDELNVLWSNGVDTYDATKKQNFRMRAALLWTINDFPAYGMLSAWSTKGKLACPYCHIHTDYVWLKFGCKHCYMGHRRFLTSNHRWRRNKSCFNSKTESRNAPVPLSGDEVLQQYESFDQVTFGRRKKRKRDDDTRWHNWRKKSIFFQLPYWKTLLIRHNLDVMHIEKNICDSILGTLLDMDGKSKDNLKARLDLQLMGIREDQHPLVRNDKYILPPACYTLTKEEKKMLCKFLHGVRMPDGYASNIKRCVDLESCKVSGLKTHDCHVIFQKLLPIGIRNILPEKVVVPLLELCQFFVGICSKELDAEELQRMSSTIPETLCRLEMIFPPAFFDIMMHLPIHLAEEARLGGPISYRWMYPIERYLRTLKGYVRNKAHPEGSIAEGYIAEECLTFCSRFLDDINTKLNRMERHEGAARNEPPSGLSIFGTIDHSKKGFTFESLSKAEMKQIRHYIITNCEEADPWANEHIEAIQTISHHNVQKRHKEEFVDWFERRIKALHDDGKASDLMYALARGPDYRARIYNRTFINGFFFRTSHVERDLNTQNSGVVVRGDESTCNIDWYGVIKKIICLDFGLAKEVVLFQCDWFDVPPSNRNQSTGYRKDQYGIIDVDTTRLRYKDDPYILGIQAEQIFYVRDVKKPNWATVVKMKPRNLYAMPSGDNGDDLTEADAEFLDGGVGEMNLPNLDEDIRNWCRSGIEGVSGDVSTMEEAQPVDTVEDQLDDDNDDDNDDTYINDGHVPHLVDEAFDDDDEFFV